jgi:hypothetical protein
MPRSLAPVLCVCLLVSVASLRAQDKKDAAPQPAGKAVPSKEKLLAQAIPGYKHLTVEGFDVLIHKDVLEHNDDPRYKRKPLEVLELELGTINRVLPPRTVKVLRTIVIWVEWEDKEDPDLEKRVIAKYYGFSGNAAVWALNKHKHPWKANNVEIINMRSLTAEHQPSRNSDRCVILHELAHAVHHHIFGSNNPYIKAAYRQAMDRKLYDESTDVRGRKIKPYARTNEREYFAELSCAYLNQLHYYPHTREELKKHDPLGYKMMEQTWGSPKQLEAALKAEAERVAVRKLAAARKLQADGKPQEARVELEKLLEYYPRTRVTAEAEALLEKIKP